MLPMSAWHSRFNSWSLCFVSPANSVLSILMKGHALAVAAPLCVQPTLHHPNIMPMMIPENSKGTNRQNRKQINVTFTCFTIRSQARTRFDWSTSCPWTRSWSSVLSILISSSFRIRSVHAHEPQQINSTISCTRCLVFESAPKAYLAHTPPSSVHPHHTTPHSSRSQSSGGLTCSAVSQMLSLSQIFRLHMFAASLAQ